MVDIMNDLLKVCWNKIGRKENENEDEEHNIKMKIREKINLLTEQKNTNNFEHENELNPIFLNKLFYIDTLFENNNFNYEVSSENKLEINNEDSSENNSEINNEVSSENNSEINNEVSSGNNLEINTEEDYVKNFDFINESDFDFNNFDFMDFGY